MGIVFLLVGILSIANLTYLTSRLEDEHSALMRHIDCNNRVTEVLQKRSNAREAVDAESHEFNMDMEAVLEEMDQQGTLLLPGDPIVQQAKESAKRAAQARTNPDLWTPYPDCTLGE